MYVLIADDTYPGHTSSDEWQPLLHPYQQAGADALFLTFINPTDMAVPPAMAALAAGRGSGSPGSVPSDTLLIFSVGGELYSHKPNPWPFLESPEAARAMAAQVARWPSDGIDLDIESGAGDQSNAGTNMVCFVDALRQARPGFIITQPVYGESAVAAENYVVKQNKADRIGIMVYSVVDSLSYISNWDQHGKNLIIAGIGGLSEDYAEPMACEVKQQGLGGMMVWYASVLDAATNQSAIVYEGDPDATRVQSMKWAAARKSMALADPSNGCPGLCHAISGTVTDGWCNLNCHAKPPNCPSSICSCGEASLPIVA